MTLDVRQKGNLWLQASRDVHLGMNPHCRTKQNGKVFNSAPPHSSHVPE
jgi:hypothetical protein